MSSTCKKSSTVLSNASNNDTTHHSSKQCRVNGKFIKKKRLDHKLKISEVGKKNKGRKVVIQPPIHQRPVASVSSVSTIGNRIVNIDHLSECMKCKDCSENLSFDKIEDEVRYGLASIFKIRCSHCLSLNKVSTDKAYTPATGKKQVYETNTRCVLGNFK